MKRHIYTLRGVIVLALLVLAPAARAAGPLPPIRHVFIIVLENKAYKETFRPGTQAPYLATKLVSRGALLPNYYGVTHESTGNYLALISGQGSNPQTQSDCQFYSPFAGTTFGADGQLLGNGCVYPPSVRTVANQLSAKGLTWKAYMEDMGNAHGQPKTCRHPTLGKRDQTQSARRGDQYASRHNPFVYFKAITSTPACSQDDVPLTRLPADLRSTSSTASYSFITPNLCDDGHDLTCVDGKRGGLYAANAFLRTWVPRIMASPAYRQGGLLAIVFDEAEDALDWAKNHPPGVPPGGDASACCHEPQFPNTTNNGFTTAGRGGGRTGAVLLSPFIDSGTVDKTGYNHFSLLRSVEDLFGLGHLGYAGMSGLQPLGPSVFTCYASGKPRPRHGRLSRGSEIKLATIVRRAGHRPVVEVKLWHPGRVAIKARHSRHKEPRRVGRSHKLGLCQPLRVRLPFRHGKAMVSARAFRGVERRTLSF